MDGFNMVSIKLNNCRNCFSIAQNEHYVAAVGDQIVIYSKDDWNVVCVITSKVFPHPYSLQFLSEHTFIVKNNYAQYMVYDILNKDVLWKFKPRGYDSIDVNLIVSSKGVIYDMLTHRHSNACCSQLVIFPNAQQYEIQDLAESEIEVEGWPGKNSSCSRIGLYSGNNQRMYLLKEYVISRGSRGEYVVEYVLFQNNVYEQSLWRSIKRWRFDKPINFKVNLDGKQIVRDELKRPIFFDEQYIVWNDLVCENWQTGEYYSFNEQGILNTPARMERRCNAEYNLDFWLVRGGNTTQIRQYKTWQHIPMFCDIENWSNIRICDIDILPNSGRLLIGTMSGLFLCDPLLTHIS